MIPHIRPNDVCYLRVRYVGPGAQVNPEHKQPSAAVQVVNRAGFAQNNGATYYVNQSDLITPAEAMRAVRGAK